MGVVSGGYDRVVSYYGYVEHKNMMVMMEKRQLFLRSYRLCRKRRLRERIKTSLVGLKRVMVFRLRSARKLTRMVLSRIGLAFSRRRRRYVRFKSNHYNSSFNPRYLW